MAENRKTKRMKIVHCLQKTDSGASNSRKLNLDVSEIQVGETLERVGHARWRGRFCHSQGISVMPIDWLSQIRASSG